MDNREETPFIPNRRESDAGAAPEKGPLIFDFDKPDRIPKSQLRAIRFLHEGFVRNLASSLPAYLHAYASGRLVSVEQIPYSAFLEGLPPNPCTVSVNLAPYRDTAILEINCALIFASLELLLGGNGTPAKSVSRELTDMERHLLGSLFRIIIGDLEQAWREVEDVKLSLDSTDTKMLSARGLGPNEAVVAIGIEFRIDDAVGMINLAIPSITLKSIIKKFDQQGTANEAAVTDTDQHRILDLLSNAAVTVEPRIVSKLRLGDLLALKAGSVVLLDHAISQPIVGTANGKVKLEGQIVGQDGRRDFLVTQVRKASGKNDAA